MVPHIELAKVELGHAGFTLEASELRQGQPVLGIGGDRGSSRGKASSLAGVIERLRHFANSAAAEAA